MARDAELLDVRKHDLELARRQGHYSKVYAITRLITGTGRGAKPRWSMKTSQPTVDENSARMMRPAIKGGWNAKVVPMPEFLDPDFVDRRLALNDPPYL